MTFAQSLQSIVTFFIQLFVIFPYNALTTPRHGPLRPPKRIGAKPARANDTNRSNPTMISDGLHKLCMNKESVSALLAKDPTLAPGDAWKQLYGDYVPTSKGAAGSGRDSGERHSISAEELQRAAECGNWGPSQPSELFLKVRTFHLSRGQTLIKAKIYHDALGPVEQDVAAAMVSPSLMGSCGVVPLTIISVYVLSQTTWTAIDGPACRILCVT